MSSGFQILRGDVLEILPAMPEASVHMACTSPPYWGLRCYNIPPSIWGGDLMCAHEWGEQERGRRKDILPSEISEAGRLGTHDKQTGQNDGGHFCLRCSGWRGSLGLEPSIDLYVEHMVHVFRLVRRVMRPEATCWLNLGDCYIANPHGTGRTFDPKYPSGRDRSEGDRSNRTNTPASLGLKPKDLCMIPFRVALALQDDGWYLRSVIPWVKHNGMPESVDDRPTSMVEYLFLLAKSADAFYDREAGRMPLLESTVKRELNGYRHAFASQFSGSPTDKRHQDGDGKQVERVSNPKGRARRNSDWFFSSLEGYSREFQGMLLDEAGDPLAMAVNPQPFSLEMCDACETCYEKREYRQLQAVLTCKSCKHTWEESGPKLSRHCPACGSDKVQHVRVCACGAKTWVSHFATFPGRLVEPCILLGTSDHGCCSECGAPYVRVLEKRPAGDWHPDPKHKHDKGAVNRTAKWAKEAAQSSGARVMVNTQAARDAGREHDQPFVAPVTLGWEPSCRCGAPAWVKEDDLKLIFSPLCRGEEREDPSFVVGRAGFARPRREKEGSVLITRFEQRAYAEQLRKSPHCEQMEREAGPAFAHYIRTDRSGARPIPPDLFKTWLERGWLFKVDLPTWKPPPTVPCTVLDPFAGSGRAGLAAVKLGRNFKGIEANTKYCKMAEWQAERLRQAQTDEESRRDGVLSRARPR